MGQLSVAEMPVVSLFNIRYMKNTSGGDITASSIFSGGYVDGPADPLYCFGHGHSYTTFELSDLELSASEILTDGKLEISCNVKNTGNVAGDEVVQLYSPFKRSP